MDYCKEAMISALEEQRIMHREILTKLVNESDFIYESMLNGYINPQDAQAQYAPVTEARILDALIEFVNRIVAHFKEKSVERSKKYGKWIKEYGDEIKARAAKTGSLKLAPLWKGEWDKDGPAISRAITNGFNSYNGGKYTDYTFTKDFLAKETVLTEEGTAALTDALKNYFRFGIKGTDRPDNMTVNGDELAGLIDDMISYILSFDSAVVKHVTTINNTLLNLSKKVTEAPSTESFTGLTPDTWVAIEQRTVAESMLTILANYSVVTEAPTPATENPPSGGDNEEKPEPTSKVEKVDDSKDKPGENAPGKDKEKSKEKSESATYLDNVKTFAKFALSAYQTVLDERFILYINICKTIGDNSGKGPKFDRKGNYISRKDQEAKEGTTKVTKKKK